MNTFLARTGSNSTTIKQSLPCGCVQFRGRVPAPPPLDPPPYNTHDICTC